MEPGGPPVKRSSTEALGLILPKRFLEPFRSPREEDTTTQNNTTTSQVLASPRLSRLLPDPIPTTTEEDKEKQAKVEPEVKEGAPISPGRGQLVFNSIKSGVLTFAESVGQEAVAQLSREELKRQDVIYELVLTEEQYVKDLLILIQLFWEPLQKRQLISAEEGHIIFSNINELYDINNSFLEALQQRQNLSPVVSEVGDLFMQHIEQFRQYAIFCSSQSVILSKLKELRQRPEVTAFLKETFLNPQCRLLEMDSFLLAPLQRLCKYPLLIREILRHTDSTHKDYAQVSDALESMKRVVDYVNEKTRQVENEAKLEELQGRLEYITGLRYELAGSGRNFMREGEFLHHKKDKSGLLRAEKMYLCLFNDILLTGRPHPKKEQHHQIFETIPVEKLLVREVVVMSSKGMSTAVNFDSMFELVHAGKEIYRLQGSDSIVVRQWIKDLQGASQRQLRTGVRTKKEKAPQAQSNMSGFFSDDDTNNKLTKYDVGVTVAATENSPIRLSSTGTSLPVPAITRSRKNTFCEDDTNNKYNSNAGIEVPEVKKNLYSVIVRRKIGSLKEKINFGHKKNADELEEKPDVPVPISIEPKEPDTLPPPNPAPLSPTNTTTTPPPSVAILLETPEATGSDRRSKELNPLSPQPAPTTVVSDEATAVANNNLSDKKPPLPSETTSSSSDAKKATTTEAKKSSNEHRRSTSQIRKTSKYQEDAPTESEKVEKLKQKLAKMMVNYELLEQRARFLEEENASLRLHLSKVCGQERTGSWHEKDKEKEREKEKERDSKDNREPHGAEKRRSRPLMDGEDKRHREESERNLRAYRDRERNREKEKEKEKDRERDKKEKDKEREKNNREKSRDLKEERDREKSERERGKKPKERPKDKPKGRETLEDTGYGNGSRDRDRERERPKSDRGDGRREQENDMGEYQELKERPGSSRSRTKDSRREEEKEKKQSRNTSKSSKHRTPSSEKLLD